MQAKRIGTYEPLLALASGGMASVHLARQVSGAGIERLVVMKRVHPHLLQNREFCDMFLDEGRISSSIRHSNVVSVIDVAEIAGELCLVQEYVESMSLSHLLTRAAAVGERLRPPVVARIVCDMLAGLHAAHRAVDLRGQPLHVVHRDVSPSNVVVGLDGVSRLIDFGIAKAATRLSVTDSGVVKGKFAYMAPEQLKHQSVDCRTDVFASSAVLYQALTGIPPFGTSSDGDTVLRVLVGEIPDPTSFVPSLPKAFDAVVQRGLARDAEERYPTAAELRDAIEAACRCASTQEVAAVVERLGGEALAKTRDDLRRAIEALTSEAESSSANIDSKADAPVAVTIASPEDSVRERGSKVSKVRVGRQPWLWGISAGTAVVLAGLVTFALRSRESPAIAPASIASSPSPDPVVPPAKDHSADVPPIAIVPPPRQDAAPWVTPTQTARPAPSPRVQPRPSELHRKNPYAE